jgi:hypothetical protein
MGRLVNCLLLLHSSSVKALPSNLVTTLVRINLCVGHGIRHRLQLGSDELHSHWANRIRLVDLAVPYIDVLRFELTQV